MSGELTVAVVAAGRVPEWARRCIDALAREPGVQLVGAVRPAPGPVRSGLVDRMSRRRSSALRLVDAGLAPLGDTRDLDVVVDLAGTTTTEHRRPPARHGCWRFAFGPEGTNPAGPVGLADIVEGRPTAELRLLADTADGRTSVLRHGTVRTIAHSWTRHRDGLLLHGVDWPALACRDVRAGRHEAPAAGRPPPADAPPSLTRLARLARRLLAAHARRVVRSLMEAQWHVGVVDTPIEAFLRPGELPPPTWLPGPPRGGFYADPFPSPDGRRVIVERFGWRDRVGSLQALDPASTEPPRPVAAPGHHISYPYVVPDAVDPDGRAYCTPETAALGEVGLYRFVGEPVRIEKVRTLVDGVAAVDPTVTFHRGRWWLFFTDGDRDADADLHVWHAGDLIGPWHPHARNPVKVDVRSSRPAGTPFTCGGRLFRPAMDNSRAYGQRIVINQVVELTPDDFAERVAAVVPPFPGPFGRGIHTLAAAGRSTIVDGRRLRIVPTALPARIRAHRDGRLSG